MLLPKTINTFGVWTQYTNFRFKEPHDILLKDGKTLFTMYPNADGWSQRGTDHITRILISAYMTETGNDYVKDSDVVAIRLLTDRDIKERCPSWFTGPERLKRIGHFHGDGRQHVIISERDLIKDHEVRELINSIRDIAVRYGASQQLRAHIAKEIKIRFERLFRSKHD